MKLLLGILAAVFIIAGFAGFSFGIVPALVFWAFAILCLVGIVGPRRARATTSPDRIEREIR